MNVKKTIYLAVMMLTLSTLLINRASASQIFVFAPSNYAGIGPSNPEPFTEFGWAGSPLPSYSVVDGATGLTTVHGYWSGGWAEASAGTGATQYTGINQSGSIHGDTWINGRVGVGGGKIIVTLMVLMYNPSTNTVDYWTKSVTYGTPVSIKSAVDIGITTFTSDISSPNGLGFMWITGCWYNAIMKILAQGGTGVGPKFISTLDGKYDDILFIAYTSSPEPHWVKAPSNAETEFNQAIANLDLAAKNFEETNLYVDPSETTSAMAISVGIPVLASITIVFIGLFTLRKKTKTNITS